MIALALRHGIQIAFYVLAVSARTETASTLQAPSRSTVRTREGRRALRC